MATLVPTYELSKEIGARVEIDARTVGELIDRGIERWGEPFREATVMCAIAVNGRAVSLLRGRRTKLKPDDVVWLVKAAGGG